MTLPRTILTHRQPRTLVFGIGCSKQCAVDYAQSGRKRALLVTAPQTLALAESLAAELRAAAVEVDIWPGVDREPTVSLFEVALAFARRQRCDGVVGLGGEYHVPHGVANAVLMPYVLRFNLPAAPWRYAQVAAALGVPAEPDETAMARKGLERLADLSRDCGIPQRLSDLGVPQAAVNDMARAAMTVTRLLKNNLRPMTESDAAEIYRETLL